MPIPGNDHEDRSTQTEPSCAEPSQCTGCSAAIKINEDCVMTRRNGLRCIQMECATGDTHGQISGTWDGFKFVQKQ